MTINGSGAQLNILKFAPSTIGPRRAALTTKLALGGYWLTATCYR